MWPNGSCAKGGREIVAQVPVDLYEAGAYRRRQDRPPTGKSFTLLMCTVGHWKNGVMDEEYLFWDNQSGMKQIGVTS